MVAGLQLTCTVYHGPIRKLTTVVAVLTLCRMRANRWMLSAAKTCMTEKIPEHRSRLPHLLTNLCRSMIALHPMKGIPITARTHSATK